MILATDMSKHFDLLGSFMTKYNADCNLDFVEEERYDILQVIMKCGDIGHTAKESSLHFR